MLFREDRSYDLGVPKRFLIDGCWDLGRGIARPYCLWMVLWKDVDPFFVPISNRPNSWDLEQIKGQEWEGGQDLDQECGSYILNRVGLLAGHCGDGLFEVEPFVAATSVGGGHTKSLWIGQEDRISSQEVPFERLPLWVESLFSEAQEELWEWNSHNNWLEAREVRLYPYNIKGLARDGNYVFKKSDDLGFVNIARQSMGFESVVKTQEKVGKPPLLPKDNAGSIFFGEVYSPTI